MTFFALVFLISGSLSAEASESGQVYSSNYIYDMLETDAEKKFYDKLKEACETIDNSKGYFNSTERVTVPLGLDADRAIEVSLIFMNNNPQYFWLDNTYRAFRAAFSPNYIAINVLEYFKDGTVRQSAKKKIMKTAQEYIDEALRYNTQYDRALYLHNVLLDNVGYEEGDWDQSIASVFLEKQTVCAGFSKAYAMLCNAVGIDSVMLTGNSHAWNKIKLYDHWFAVDVTNDYNSPIFFLLSDKELSDLDAILSSNLRHVVGKNEYPYYYDKFPECPLSYIEATGTSPTPLLKIGDANADGAVNVRDCSFIALCLSHGDISPLSEYADFNRDGKINVRDAASLAYSLAVKKAA